MNNYSTTVPTTVLAFVIVLFSLMSLLFAGRSPETTTVVRFELPQRASDIAPRFILAAR